MGPRTGCVCSRSLDPQVTLWPLIHWEFLPCQTATHLQILIQALSAPALLWGQGRQRGASPLLGGKQVHADSLLPKDKSQFQNPKLCGLGHGS